MGKREAKKGYFLDNDGYYVTNEIFKGRAYTKKCPNCGNRLLVVFAEKYLEFENGAFMIMGNKIYGFECDTCNCGFIYSDE